MKKRFMGIVVIVCCLTMAITCLADYDSSVIQQVQQALNDAGFDCGTPDGIAGKGTAAAVSAYQEANGLTVDGQISEELLTSLGIGAVTSEDASSETAAPDGTTDAPGEFSEDAYDGEWTSISDKYEIYLPAGMTIADDEELEQLSESSYYDMSTYLFSATADTGMKIQHLRISDDFISQLKEAGAGINSAQDYWDLWKEQISIISRTGNINGIDGLYVDNSDGNDGSPIPTYAWSADDEIHFFEFSNCGDENGIELAKTIMESLRIAENADIEETELAEAVETVAEFETESAAEAKA